MTAEDFEELFGKNITIRMVRGVGYDRTYDGWTLVIASKRREFYVTSQSPLELELREIH